MKTLEQLFLDFSKHNENVSDKVKKRLNKDGHTDPFLSCLDNVLLSDWAQLPACMHELIFVNNFPPESWNNSNRTDRIHRLKQVAPAYPFFKIENFTQEHIEKKLSIFLYAICDMEMNFIWEIKK
jgi:hypothetical protein